MEGLAHGIDLTGLCHLGLREAALAAAVAFAGVVVQTLRSAGEDPAARPRGRAPTLLRPAAAERYFSKRKGLVLRRVVEILAGSAEFLLSLKTEGNLDGNPVSDETRQRQAVQLRELLSYLGPTFVKAGQALSIRVDLLPEVYLKELRKLQDAVPPFPTEEARVLTASWPLRVA